MGQAMYELIPAEHHWGAFVVGDEWASAMARAILILVAYFIFSDHWHGKFFSRGKEAFPGPGAKPWWSVIRLAQTKVPPGQTNVCWKPCMHSKYAVKITSKPPTEVLEMLWPKSKLKTDETFRGGSSCFFFLKKLTSLAEIAVKSIQSQGVFDNKRIFKN